MNNRRGLTLLESLIAVAILSLLAAASIPLLRTSLAVLHEPPPEIRLDELANLADAAIADPQAFGLEPDAFSTLQTLDLTWPDHPTRQTVVARRLQSSDEETGHAWVIFTFGGWSVSRWMHVDESSSPNEAEASP